MSTENPVKMESLRITENGPTSSSDTPLQHVSNIKESEKRVVVLLEEFDRYLEDINDRLTISRMVSDSVIKGMVSAVEQEAEEKIARKDSEVAGLKEKLRAHNVDKDENKLVYSSPLPWKETNTCLSSCLLDHGRLEGFVKSHMNEVKDQLMKLKKEVYCIKCENVYGRVNPGSGLAGLGGILHEKVSQRWINVDNAFNGLESLVDSVFSQLEDIASDSKSSLFELQQEWELREEVEAMVITDCIMGLQYDFERKLWDLSSRYSFRQDIDSLKEIKEISALREELDVLSKLLSGNDNGQLISLVSWEVGENCSINKAAEPLNRKASGNHVPSAFPCDKHDELIMSLPENLEDAQLKHLNRDELIHYFKDALNKMKRCHETTVQQLIEEVFSLKREHPRERGPSLRLKKEKELEGLRRKIPEVVLKLDDILTEREKVPEFSLDMGSFGTMRDRLEALLSENHQLRDILSDKKKEVKCLVSQVSNAAEKICSHSLAEANLSEVIQNITCKGEDAKVEASISEEVYKCFLEELVMHVHHMSDNIYDQNNVKKDFYEVVHKEIPHVNESSCQCKFEDAYMDSVILQGLDGMMFLELLKDARAKLSSLKDSYGNEMKHRAVLELEVVGKERSLDLRISENQDLKLRLELLATFAEEKERLALEREYALSTQNREYEKISCALDNLRVQSGEQQMSIAQLKREKEVLEGNLAQRLEQIETYERDLNNLSQKLDSAIRDLSRASEERELLFAVTQEKENALISFRAKEKENLKQLELMARSIHKCLVTVANLEWSVSEDVKGNSMRLDTVATQLSFLRRKAFALRTNGSIYKQKLEKKCSDLQKAEAEVDLLGDQVDTLLNLLEKVYIALDHYSPILQHYPGIIEILKLVRKELTEESSKVR